MAAAPCDRKARVAAAGAATTGGVRHHGVGGGERSSQRPADVGPRPAEQEEEHDGRDDPATAATGPSHPRVDPVAATGELLLAPHEIGELRQLVGRLLVGRHRVSTGVRPVRRAGEIIGCESPRPDMRPHSHERCSDASSDAELWTTSALGIAGPAAEKPQETALAHTPISGRVAACLASPHDP